MDVTPQELRNSEIKEAWRGYHRDEVDELLERAAVTIEQLTQQVGAGGARSPEAALPAVSNEDTALLQRTLLLAQRTADEAVAEANEKARKLVADAESRAQATVGEAEASARRIADSERRRLDAEIQDLVARRDALQADADALEEYASSYRDRVRESLEADLERLGSGGIAAPTARPDLTSAHVQASPLEPVRDDAVEPSYEGGTGSPSWSEDTRAISLETATAVEAPPSRAAFTAPTSPAPSEREWPPPAAHATAAEAASENLGSWLEGSDEWKAAEADTDDPLPWEQRTAAHDPFGAAAPAPVEATTVDVPDDALVDVEPLDDESFFASLRDAVRDDQPLGPRDDDPSLYYDDELADDRRRFRRR